MNKEELLKELEDRGIDYDTRALIVDDVLDIISKQISKLKAENESITVAYESLCSYINPMKEERKQLQQQLKEKDQEIDELKDQLQSYLEEIRNHGTCGLCEKLDKSNTKQVCDKIRERVTSASGLFADIEAIKEFKLFLDQIEKGEV